MEKFSEFITEVKEEPYRILLLVHDTPDDPNKTGVKIDKQAKQMGIDSYQLELEGGYFTTNEKGNKVAHNFNVKTGENDDKGFELIPENTMYFVRGARGTTAARYATELDLAGIYGVNSRYTHRVCDDKWINYLVCKKHNLRQPRTEIITNEQNIEKPIELIGNKYPFILKTIRGTQGIGVVFIDSEKALKTTLQLLYKLDDEIGLLIQEYIKTDFDVRVHVLNDEVVAGLKRPVIEGDFRSNITQGSLPLKIELTELEKSECIKATQSVKGKWVGVDFIPSKNREKEPPYFIEVNGTPGTGHINELNNINIQKMILDTFKNRDNWT